MRFADHVTELGQRFGAEAQDARHEIYFICARRSRLGPRLRAALAALRDAALCLSLGTIATAMPPVLMILSRAGPSGHDALRPFMADLDRRGIRYGMMVHPRLRSALPGASGPLRPSLKAWRHAVGAFGIAFAYPDQRAFVVRCCLFRLRLWQGAWERALANGSGGVVILHNDFELFCVAALNAGAGRWSGICVQHGLPTDEFFPTRAPVQIVWGQSSRDAYIAAGTPPGAIRFGPSRMTRQHAGAPLSATVRLVSQTHTPVFGRPLAREFLDLATRLARHMDKRGDFAILLHPEEVRLGHAYADRPLAGLSRPPPHREFGDEPAPSSIVVGFCSTALIKAAANGHLVIGINWQVPASHAAVAVGRPALTVDDADQLGALIARLLADPTERAAMLRAQQAWLDRCFTRGDDWMPEVAA